MTDQTSDGRITQLEQRQQQDATIAQIHEILPLVTQGQQRTQLTLVEKHTAGDRH